MIKRYLVPKIHKIFLDQNKFKTWLLIEQIVVEFWYKKGHFNKSTYEILKHNLNFDWLDVIAEESKTHHDFVAFLNVSTRNLSTLDKKWIHYGLTTTDVVDTANSLMLRDVNKLIMEKINELLYTLEELAFKYKDVAQVGRTHGIHAELTSFGYKFAIFYNDMLNSLETFFIAKQNIECVMMSGSVGTFANTTTELQEFLSEELNMPAAICSTQVLSRERYAAYFNALNLMGQTIHKIAFNLRELAITEIGEISEVFDEKQQVGSSSMPHKRNPIVLENICGLARLLNGYSLSANENIPLWHERDISHSSVERILLLDATTVFYHIVEKLNHTLKNMQVNEENIQKNIELTHGNIFSQTAMLKILPKTIYTRNELHEKIKALTEKVIINKSNFKQELSNSEFSKNLKTNDLNEIFDPKYHLRFMDEIYAKIFKNNNFDICFEKILFHKYEILESVTFLSQKINNYFKKINDKVLVLSVLDGAVVFAGHLLPKLNFEVIFNTVSCKFYGNEVNAGENNKNQNFKLPDDVKQFQHCLILEDLYDSGSTVDFLKKELNKQGIKNIKVCCLFKKAENLINNIVDWYGLEIPNEWVAGFGLDSKKKYRHLDYLGVLKKDYY